MQSVRIIHCFICKVSSPPYWQVYCVEPMPSNLDLLRQTAQKSHIPQHGFHIIDAAIGASNDPATGTRHAKSTIAALPNYTVLSTRFLGEKTPGYAPAPCHITGIYQPLPGSRHFKLTIL